MATVDAVCAGAWGTWSGTATAVKTVNATLTRNWGAWSGNFSVGHTVGATAHGAWGGLTGSVSAFTPINQAIPSGNWYGWVARAVATTSPTISATWDTLFANPNSTVIRRVDIYQANGTTPYAMDCGIIGGSVSVDNDRDERRTFDITIDSVHTSDLTIGPGKLWYDKVIKIYRGLRLSGVDYIYLLGTFMPDQIQRAHFPNQIHITGRDFTKKLMLAKFPVATTFEISSEQLAPVGFTVVEILLGVVEAEGLGLVEIGPAPIRPGIAGGDPALLDPAPHQFSYEAGTPYWTALKEICNSQGYQLYYSPQGVLQARAFVDPVTAPISFIFQVGASGNLATYTKTTNDSEIYNIVNVTGQTGSLRLPVWGQARNDEPTSPTRISELGPRMLPYYSPLVTANNQAEGLAAQLLAVSALESYVIDMEALVVPWLEVGTAVQFVAPVIDGSDPTTFLLTSFEIPLDLRPMSAMSKRITIVG